MSARRTPAQLHAEIRLLKLSLLASREDRDADHSLIEVQRNQIAVLKGKLEMADKFIDALKALGTGTVVEVRQ